MLEEAQKWGPNGSYNIAMNILIGAAGGGATGTVSSITKESLSWAANEMRQAMIDDSKKFNGICDGKDYCFDNKSGKSAGINGDGKKVAGGRVDLAKICGKGRCTKDSSTKSGYKEDDRGRVRMNAIDENDNPVDLEKLLVEHEDAWRSPMGGYQGLVGKFLFYDYSPGSMPDAINEAYAGSHDMMNKWYWYDDLGNIKEELTDMQRYAGEVLNYVNVVPATPFALSTLLPAEVWNAISFGLEAMP